ncbi:sugar kinase [Undibacterium sp. YM2]|uniref:sugar kinase n=1 Tax=Undibacterium sp. YM2 TaxID=2058625 RepID=UPI001331F68E|nr:sugar kinase [Undibacterium sp. YM2]BBB68738.1 sugar kinase [Undibacterium sp. YM2]
MSSIHGTTTRQTENKIILVTRKTRLEELIVKYNTVGQARFYIEHLGGDFAAYQTEHDNYLACVSAAESSLTQLVRLQKIDRSFLPNMIFGRDDIVIAVGQDGLVVNTMKYLDGQRLIGVNPDVQRWDGVLLPFQVRDLPKIVPEVLQQRRPVREVTMAMARLNNGQTMLGVNDIFIGPKSHISASYTIQLQERQERQSSSGIIISTGMGSTGWMKSILTGAAALQERFDDPRQLIYNIAAEPPTYTADWDARELMFAVREPFPSKTSSATLVRGQILEDSKLQVTSLMPEHGVIFSDGIEADYLEFNAGLTAEIGIADRRGYLVV